jgi:CRP-like cAMP-binding protein
MDKRHAAEFARTHGWLATTPLDFQDEVVARADHVRLQARQPLYAAGDHSGGVFGLIKGRLDVHLSTLGNDHSLAFIGQPGIWIGDIAAVTGQKRIMTINASSRCDVLRLPRAEMMRIVERTPAAWHYFADLLAQNFARAVEIVEYLRCSNPSRRIAAMLLNLAGERPSQAIRVSQIEMAEISHLGRTNVQSALMDLAQRGLVRRGYCSIEIVDIAALRLFAKTPDRDGCGK